MAKVRITLVKSLIGCKPFQKKTASSLGLSKIGDKIEHDAGPVVEGKVKQISHLVKVENV
ncbi:MAG: 50S ribosomal protein L30 [Ruminococcaceae bacterium]|nr:50S ribosomal protein L30 [Oscillospiraceae bacterium]